MTRRQDRIVRALTQAFAPLELQVEDDSHRHHGHAGARPGGETHYSVRIVAEAFTGKSAVARHRLVNEALADEFKSGLHALAIDARSP
ncbi:BolA family protein [Chthonobacter rhizosphaerae]|uniref:BolA family protein n=1 Tax=Chthonobacter rhizosphaerae TaxID=2735553 RepID=UPI0015EE7E3A|nr:BolA family protein [Chthonobacter rhizosphaerae]